MTLLTFFAGLVIFLYAMRSLESGLRRATGEKLKRWLSLQGDARLSAVTSGVVITAILQSSSMVSLVLLALLSAEIIPLVTAIGVMLGANLGTTLTGWVVTVVGFKMDFDALVIPLLGGGAALQLVFTSNEKVRGYGLALFAFGLLILGLDQMKTGVAGVPELFDLEQVAALPPIAHLLFGVVFAAVMQSSSAVMVITLAMLSAGLIPLAAAAALVIGADLGTTSTTVLGSLGESRIKKQLAFAHVFFNLLTNTLAFLLLLPVLDKLLVLLSIKDPMFGLVAFHSTFNLLGVLLFLPILGSYSRWIERRLPAPQNHLAEYFSVPLEVPDAAIKALHAAKLQLWSDALRVQLKILKTIVTIDSLTPKLPPTTLSGTLDESYLQLKIIEDRILNTAAKLRATNLTLDQRNEIAEISASVRAMIYATKTLKDAERDLKLLKSASPDSVSATLASQHAAYLEPLLFSLTLHWFDSESTKISDETSRKLSRENDHHRDKVNSTLTQQIDTIDRGTALSTWFNLNHEIHHYVRYLLNVSHVIDT